MSIYRRRRMAQNIVERKHRATLVVPVDDALGLEGERHYLATGADRVEDLRAAYWKKSDRPSVQVEFTPDGPRVVE